MERRKSIHLHIPVHIGFIYVALSLVLLPWTIYLGLTLPVHHLSAHWDTSWVGLDAALMASLLITGLLAYKRSRWVAIFASIAGSLTLVDAWFDVMSERTGFQFHQALLLAFAVELPLAAMSFWVARRVLIKNIK